MCTTIICFLRCTAGIFPRHCAKDAHAHKSIVENVLFRAHTHTHTNVFVMHNFPRSLKMSMLAYLFAHSFSHAQEICVRHERSANIIATLFSSRWFPFPAHILHGFQILLSSYYCVVRWWCSYVSHFSLWPKFSVGFSSHFILVIVLLDASHSLCLLHNFSNECIVAHELIAMYVHNLCRAFGSAMSSIVTQFSHNFALLQYLHSHKAYPDFWIKFVGMPHYS